MSAPFDTNRYVATIVSHHDGDTSHVTVAIGFDLTIALTVRWYGVNAPELPTPEGKAALAWVEAILPVGSTALMQSAKDPREKYGRYLATLFLPDGTNVNDELVKSGHAVPYFGGAR